MLDYFPLSAASCRWASPAFPLISLNKTFNKTYKAPIHRPEPNSNPSHLSFRLTLERFFTSEGTLVHSAFCLCRKINSNTLFLSLSLVSHLSSKKGFPVRLAGGDCVLTEYR